MIKRPGCFEWPGRDEIALDPEPMSDWLSVRLQLPYHRNKTGGSNDDNPGEQA